MFLFVVGFEVILFEFFIFFLREVYGYNVDVLGMFFGYDVEDLWCRCERVWKDFGIMKMLILILDNLFNYYWDYMDIFDDLVLRIFLLKEDGGSYEDFLKDVFVVLEVL